MIVMNWTLAVSGSRAIISTASATCTGSNVGSGRTLPSAWRAPTAIPAVMSVAALPTSICPQAIRYGLPSSESDFVSPVIACFVAV